MAFSQLDIQAITSARNSKPSKHLDELLSLVIKGGTAEELFLYGLRFLPRFRKKHSIDWSQLDNYDRSIVNYFHTLSILPSIPQKLQDLATDLAIYANGESVQLDSDYTNFDPSLEVSKAFTTLG